MLMEIEKYEKEKYYEFGFDSDGKFGVPADIDYTKFVEKATGKKGFNMVIAKGNMFMKGVYISKKEMKMAHKGFNKTLHDLNHMGSGYVASLFTVVPPDISYMVGWQDGLSYDDATDEVRANVHIKKTAPRYEEWQNYIDISMEIGRKPNVSMVVFAKIEYVEARELPKGAGYGKAGYAAGDLVPCMTNIQPFMVSTVTQGACNDKDGCGIGNTSGIPDTDTNETTDKPKVEGKSVEEVDKIIEENKQKMKYFKDRLKNMNGE